MTSEPVLSFERIGSSSSCHRVAMLVHGIMGFSRNMSGIGYRLLEAYPDWELILPSLNHNRTSVDACARDLDRLLDHLNVKPVLYIGHSFGGKVVMRLNEIRPTQEVCVWDAEPGFVEPSSTENVIQKLKTIPMPQASKQAFQEAAFAEGLSRQVVLWMSMNLERSPNGFVWRFNLDNIHQLVQSFGHTAIPIPGNTFFVKAGHHSHMLYSDPTKVRILENAGHWVHVDNPKGLVQIMAEAMR